MVPHADLRDWLEGIEQLGELKRFRGAHWDLEIGAITELSREGRRPPALLFDEIAGYPRGFRVLVNPLDSIDRLAFTLGLPLGDRPIDFVRRWKDHARGLKPLPPRYVSSGPVLEQVFRDGEVDLLRLPAPRWHEGDGGRYLGTADVVITRDPEEGWVNLGTYRMMVHDATAIGLYISPGKHGRIHREKQFALGQPLRVAVSFGHDPLLFLAACQGLPPRQCEYDYVGGIRGEPVEVLQGEFSGLPIPAQAEIVIEGEIVPNEHRDEGPFGEYTGYYASKVRAETFVRVRTLMHRRDPIILSHPPLKPSLSAQMFLGPLVSARTWLELEEAGVPDVRGVWHNEAAGVWAMIVVSIKQRYPGHARQAGLVACGCRSGAYLGRYVIVVDEDIDPANTSDVLWALAYRSDPAQSIEIIRRCWSGPLDPAIPVDRKGFNSRAIIDACRPYEWISEFPAVSCISPQLRQQTLRRWGSELAD